MPKRSSQLTLVVGAIGLAQLACFGGLYFISATQPAGQGGTLASLVNAFWPLALVGVAFVGYAWLRFRRRK